MKKKYYIVLDEGAHPLTSWLHSNNVTTSIKQARKIKTYLDKQINIINKSFIK